MVKGILFTFFIHMCSDVPLAERSQFLHLHFHLNDSIPLNKIKLLKTFGNEWLKEYYSPFFILICSNVLLAEMNG